MLKPNWDSIKLGAAVIVTAADYVYSGWLVAVFAKRRGGIRVVVEDDNGRLFVHNAKQLGVPDDVLSALIPPVRLN